MQESTNFDVADACLECSSDQYLSLHIQSSHVHLIGFFVDKLNVPDLYVGCGEAYFYSL